MARNFSSGSERTKRNVWPWPSSLWTTPTSFTSRRTPTMDRVKPASPVKRRSSSYLRASRKQNNCQKPRLGRRIRRYRPLIFGAGCVCNYWQPPQEDRSRPADTTTWTLSFVIDVNHDNNSGPTENNQHRTTSSGIVRHNSPQSTILHCSFATVNIVVLH